MLLEDCYGLAKRLPEVGKQLLRVGQASGQQLVRSISVEEHGSTLRGLCVPGHGPIVLPQPEDGPDIYALSFINEFNLVVIWLELLPLRDACLGPANALKHIWTDQLALRARADKDRSRKEGMPITSGAMPACHDSSPDTEIPHARRQTTQGANRQVRVIVPRGSPSPMGREPPLKSHHLREGPAPAPHMVQGLFD
jgi:hypothetical protein